MGKDVAKEIPEISENEIDQIVAEIRINVDEKIMHLTDYLVENETKMRKIDVARLEEIINQSQSVITRMQGSFVGNDKVQ